MPQSTCNFLSSTEAIIEDNEDNNWLVTAPSLDGIYYGGAGAASACAMSFFYDYATGELVVVPSVRLFVSGAPLKVQADPIEVASTAAPP